MFFDGKMNCITSKTKYFKSRLKTFLICYLVLFTTIIAYNIIDPSDLAHVPYEDWAILIGADSKMKPFKTYRQQLAILRSRGLSIPNGSKAMRILERENYYSLINGYKDLFLVRDVTGKSVSPEQYIPGTTFDELYSLYTFDRALRNILLEAILKFEISRLQITVNGE